MNYKGTIIEESLENSEVLKKVMILSTEVEEVKESFKTPWLTQWTLHKVEIPEDVAQEVAEDISKCIDTEHSHSWYADFKNDKWHYIIFPNKIFKIDRPSELQYQEARDYGISLGIPAHQVDFSPDIK